MNTKLIALGAAAFLSAIAVSHKIGGPVNPIDPTAFEKAPAAPAAPAVSTAAPAPQPPAPASSYDTDKAAVGYWKAACDIKHGHVARSAGGDQVVAYWKELGIDPDQAYGDANATTRAEMLDKKAGTNCFA
jgi:hypothetical protein